jgi:hypothetical protein
MKKGVTLIELLIWITISFVMAGSLSILIKTSEDYKMHQKAIELGMAEYVMVDNKGNTEFKWKNVATNIPSAWLSTTVTNENEVYTIKIYKTK